VDGRMYGRTYLLLLGRLGGVELINRSDVQFCRFY